MRFRPEQHVRRQRDFRDVRENGRRFDCGGFTFWYRRRPVEALKTPDAQGAEGGPQSSALATSSRPLVASPAPRVGVIASTAAVGNAVRRNRAKRRLREVFRKNQTLVPAGYDLLLVARQSLEGLACAEIEKKFVAACQRLFPKNP